LVNILSLPPVLEKHDPKQTEKVPLKPVRISLPFSGTDKDDRDVFLEGSMNSELVDSCLLNFKLSKVIKFLL
jgi:hypothetical protein